MAAKETLLVWVSDVRDTPLGDVWIGVSENGLLTVSLWAEREHLDTQLARDGRLRVLYDPQRTALAAEQLRDYLNGQRRVFDLSLDWSLTTPFQQQVLRLVNEVAYGHTTTYGRVAEQLGRPSAVRAVGRANATNPLPVVIPCHRVLGADGRLHGYSAPGGLETKAWLLRLEGSWLI